MDFIHKILIFAVIGMFVITIVTIGVDNTSTNNIDIGRQEYKVLSIQKGSYFITDGIFYDLEYIDANNEIKNKRLDARTTHIYLSNESKYVINNFGFAFDEIYLNGSE